MGGLGGMIQVGVDILKTSVSEKTRRILIQTGNAIGQVAGADNVEWWQHVGFASRPPKAVPGKKAAQAIVIRRGSNDLAIGSQDERGLDLYGNLEDGETCVYAPGADGTNQGRTLYKNDGSVTHYTTDTNTADGQSVYTRTAPDGFQWVAPWGTLKFDASGLHLLHSSGASFDLGGIYGLPAPLDQISSYIRMQAGTINGSASAVSFGAGAGQPVALAPEVMAAITALQAQLTALQGAIAAFATIGINAGIAAASVNDSGAALLAAATGGAVAGIAAVSAALPLIPATTSST